MALAANALVSIIEAREFLKGEGDGDLDRIEGLINAASDYCELKADARLKSRTWTDYVLDGEGGLALSLPFQPVTGVAKVEFLTNPAPVAWELVDLATYPVIVVTPARRRIAFRNRVFPAGFQNVQLTFTAGYGDAGDLAPMPALLREVCLQAVKALFDAKDDDGVAAVTTNTGGMGSQTVTYLDRAMPKKTIEILEGYRKAAF